MELLGNARGVDADAGADDAHSYLVSGVPSSGESGHAAQTSDAGDGDALLSTAASEDDNDDEHDEAASFRPLPMRAPPTRRKIGKNLQLVLLRKYVQCAKELDGIPDRAATERLLDQAYDEFYFHGGDVNEQRMGYTEFAKLVRNRRGEMMRLRRHSGAQPSHHKKYAKERDEIRALVEELERVRGCSSNADKRRRPCQDQNSAHGLTTSQVPNSRTESPAALGVPTNATIINGEEHVLISKRKLALLLQSAQETHAAQSKLLDQVHALERQLQEIQRLHYPLGH